MTSEDREIWNKRYLQGAYADRNSPSEILKKWLHLCPPGRALDIACGIGRNARYLSESGYETIGLDISNVAIESARDLDGTANRKVEYLVHDFDNGIPVLGKFDLVIMDRFLDWRVVSSIEQHLHVSGRALFEQHLKYNSDEPLAGPRSNRFRVDSGELQTHISHMEIVREFEGLVTDSDGRKSAVVQVLAQKNP